MFKVVYHLQGKSRQYVLTMHSQARCRIQRQRPAGGHDNVCCSQLQSDLLL